MNIFEDSFTSMDQVREAWKGCDKCVFSSLWKDTGPCLPLPNSAGKDVLVVGQWPGEEDMKNKKPFSGRQGRVSVNMCVDAGFTRSKLFVTNVLLCSCPVIPTKNILTNCREQIDQTLDVIRPKIIVALGAHAAKRFDLKGSMKESHGRPGSYRGYVVVPCIHPAAIARAKSREAKQRVEAEVRSDLSKAYQLYQEI